MQQHSQTNEGVVSQPVHPGGQEVVPNEQSRSVSQRLPMVQCLRAYAVEHPEAAAMWCFGIGFLLGWKLKPRWMS